MRAKVSFLDDNQEQQAKGSGVSVEVWLSYTERMGPWTVLTVKVTLSTLVSLNRYVTPPGAQICSRCGEEHVQPSLDKTCVLFWGSYEV